METVEFKKEFLIDELGLPFCTESVLSDVIVEHGGWNLTHKIVFQHEGKYYQTYYSEGATEYQEESPWEYEAEVQCTEVELVKKEIIIYETVKED